MTALRAGAAVADISPRVPAPLAGYPPINLYPGGPQDHRGYTGRTGPCEGIADPVCARALAVSDDNGVAVLIAMDVCAVPAAFSHRVRSRLSAGYGVPADSVMITASHNHSGPDYTGYWEPVDPSVTALVEDLAVAAAGEALARRRPATVGLANGWLDGLTVNRRDPARPVDPAVPVLRLDGAHGEPVAVVYGFACHPVTAGPANRLVSAEYPGAASRLVEAAFDGAVALFVNGGAGNINPRAFPYRDTPNVVQLTRGLPPEQAGSVRSVAQARRLGTVLGGEVVRVAAQLATGPAVGGVRTSRREVAARLKDRAELDAFLNHMPHEPHAVADWRPGGELVTEVASLRIGPLALIGIPGEPFVETALSLQRDEPAGAAPAVRVAGYANDYPGYLPPPAQLAENRYESVATPLSADGVQAVIDAAADLRSRLDAA